MAEKESAAAVPTREKIAEEGNLFEWTTHPMKRRPRAAILVSIFITLCAVLAWYATDMLWFGILALLVLFASLTKFYLPTRFILTDKAVRIKTSTTTIRREWKQFRSYYPDKNGVLLSPFIEPSRLENFRGMYLIFADNRNEVVAYVKSHIRGIDDEREEKS